MSRKTSRPVAVAMPSAAQDRAITAAARADPDAQPLTAAQLAAMVPMRALRGRPKSGASKRLVSIRYSPDVIDDFRATGAECQPEGFGGGSRKKCSPRDVLAPVPDNVLDDVGCPRHLL